MSTPSYTQACERCNSKKIKCLYDAPGQPCTHCASLQAECRPRVRKKRKTAASVDADAGASSTADTSAEQPLEPKVASLPQDSHIPYNGGLDGSSTYAFQSPGNQRGPPTGSSTYIGRAHYEGDHIVDEDSARSYTAHRQTDLSEPERKTLEIWNAFELPPRAVRQSLIEAFMEHCYPWMPTLDATEKEQCGSEDGSLLLLQSIFLAASRVVSSSGLLSYATPADFYQRARALYWVAHEKQPLIVIKAITMLHWYNPDGPAFVSYDTSEYWLKIGACLAFQIGLHKEPSSANDGHMRRRVWWSLVARDAMISFSRGRPRAIRLEDSDVKRPAMLDFPGQPNEGELFIAYVDICCILGKIVELQSRGQLSAARSTEIDNALFRWSRSLPESLHLGLVRPGSHTLDLRPHNFRARQLHVIYFVCVAVLARSQAAPREVPPAAVLAASFIAGIYEDFLARDLVRVLSPTFTSFSFVASLTILTLRVDPTLWVSAMPDLQVLQTSLQELSTRWKSAIGASKAIQKALEHFRDGSSPRAPTLRQLTKSEESLFEGYPGALCRLRTPYTLEVENGRAANFNIDATSFEPGPGEMLFNGAEQQLEVPPQTFGLGDDWFTLLDETNNYFWSDFAK